MLLWEVSFMLSSEKTAAGKSGRKIWIRILSVVLAVSVVCCIEAVAQRCFDTVRYADYYMYDIRKLVEDHTDVGMVCIGASQVYHSCDTEILAERLGYEAVVDASVASQTNDGGYYLLQDMFNKFDPDTVLINLNWDRFREKPQVAADRGRLLASDRLPWNLKLKYAIDCFRPDQMLNLSAMYRFGGSVWGFSQLKSNFRKKEAARLGTRERQDRDEEDSFYYLNGFAVFQQSMPQGGMKTEHNFYSDDQVSKEEVEYLWKTVELCKREGCRVIWITVPTSMEELYGIENLQDQIDYANRFTEETGFPYLNFNLLKGREALFPDTRYSDEIHLNEEGAVVFSELLADIINKMNAGEDVSDMFYDSFEELTQEADRIVSSAAVSKDPGDGTLHISGESMQNPDIIPEYRLLYTEGTVSADSQQKEEHRTDAADFTELCTWQESGEFVVDKESLPAEYTLRLEVRRKGEETFSAFQEGF